MNFPSSLSSDNQCLPILTGVDEEQLTVFKSMKVLTPHQGEMTISKFEVLLSAEVLNYDDAVKRNAELSFCYQLFSDTGTDNVGTGNEDRRWRLYDEKCGLDIFGIIMISASPGKNRLVASLFHQSAVSSYADVPVAAPSRMICQSEVEFECCLSPDQTSLQTEQNDFFITELDFEQRLVERYIKEVHKSWTNLSGTDETVVSSSRPILTSPLARDDTHSMRSVSYKDAGDMHYVKVLIGIKSFALNVRIRAAIRRTYFQFKLDPGISAHQIDFLPYFIIGNSTIVDDWKTHRIQPFDEVPQSMSLEEAVRVEQSLHGDLLLGEELGGVVDTYYHLTQKVMAFFKWTEIENLSAAELAKDEVFVVICDDDAYLNLQDLRFYIESIIRERASLRIKTQQVQLERNSESSIKGNCSVDNESDEEEEFVLRPYYGGEVRDYDSMRMITFRPRSIIFAGVGKENAAQI